MAASKAAQAAALVNDIFSIVYEGTESYHVAGKNHWLRLNSSSNVAHNEEWINTRSRSAGVHRERAAAWRSVSQDIVKADSVSAARYVSEDITLFNLLGGPDSTIDLGGTAELFLALYPQVVGGAGTTVDNTIAATTVTEQLADLDPLRIVAEHTGDLSRLARDTSDSIRVQAQQAVTAAENASVTADRILDLAIEAGKAGHGVLTAYYDDMTQWAEDAEDQFRAMQLAQQAILDLIQTAEQLVK